eukprot:6207435-Pleurochrysis_carterae.AAC.1
MDIGNFTSPCLETGSQIGSTRQKASDAGLEVDVVDAALLRCSKPPSPPSSSPGGQSNSRGQLFLADRIPPPSPKSFAGEEAAS